MNQGSTVVQSISLSSAQRNAMVARLASGLSSRAADTLHWTLTDAHLSALYIEVFGEPVPAADSIVPNSPISKTRNLMQTNLCPLCRASMRYWSIDARFAPTSEMRTICIRTAIGFRDECLHTDLEKYDALAAKAKTLKPGHPLLAKLWTEIERIKNCNAGCKPVGRTFNAWTGRTLSSLRAKCSIKLEMAA